MMNHRRKIDELSSALPLKFTEEMDFIICSSILPVKTKYFIYVDSFKLAMVENTKTPPWKKKKKTPPWRAGCQILPTHH